MYIPINTLQHDVSIHIKQMQHNTDLKGFYLHFVVVTCKRILESYMSLESKGSIYNTCGVNYFDSRLKLFDIHVMVSTYSLKSLTNVSNSKYAYRNRPMQIEPFYSKVAILKDILN